MQAHLLNGGPEPGTLDLYYIRPGRKFPEVIASVIPGNCPPRLCGLAIHSRHGCDSNYCALGVCNEARQSASLR